MPGRCPGPAGGGAPRPAKSGVQRRSLRRGRGAAPLAFFLLAASPPQDVTVTGAFARATAVGQSTGGVFLTITSRAGDTLTGATADAAPRVSLHRMTMSGDVMQMRQLATVPLPPGQPVAFTPGSMHLMLEGLPHPLHTGETIHLTLDLAHAGAVAIAVPVGGPGASMPPMPGMRP